MTLTPEQHAERLTGIGSSDAAVALGLNPYRAPIELWQEKLGLEVEPFQGNQATKWGQLLEPAVRQEYAEQTGRVVRLPTETLHHPKHTFMLGHPDGVTDCGRLYEGKTARYPDGWGEPGSDEIPQPYMVQVQHLMIVTGLVVADVAVLIGGQDFRLYEIPADPELQELIVDGEHEFWRHVETRTAPAIDYNAPGALALVRKLYPGTNGGTEIADAMLEHWRAVYDQAIEYRDRYSAAADAAKAHLLYAMGESAVLKFADGKVLRRREVKRKGFTVDPTSYIDARFASSKE